MFPTTLPQLETERLILRNVNPADAPAFQDICQDEVIAQGTGMTPFPYPEGRATEWIAEKQAELEAGKGGAFVIAHKETGQVMGDISLNGADQQGMFEIGYIMGRDFRGQGYATEALHCVVKWYFESLPCHRLFAYCFCTNAASARILEKVGFLREGLLRQNYCQGDRIEDDYVYGLLRSDWESNTMEPTT